MLTYADEAKTRFVAQPNIKAANETKNKTWASSNECMLAETEPSG